MTTNTQTQRERTCAERINDHLLGRIEDIQDLLEHGHDDNYETIYPLAFDFVEPDTFNDQPVGYWRLQLSWGGPSDEFRLYTSGQYTYVFMDWFDGAERELTQKHERAPVEDIFEYYLECQTNRHGV